MMDWPIFVSCILVTIASAAIAWLYHKKLSRQYNKLKQSRESLDFALQSGRMGTWDINLETDTVTCSKEMLELWGIRPEDFNGQRSILQSKVHPDDLGRMISSIDSSIKHESIYELEYRIFPSPGTQRWVLSRGRCTYHRDSRRPIRFSGIICDVTDRKIREEELDRAMKARDQFFQIAGHELKTPLTCLQLQLQVNQWDVQNAYPEAFTPEKIEANLFKQQQHLNRITRLIDHILDESRISEKRFFMQFEKFNLNDMVKDVLDQFRVTAQAASVEVILISSENIEGTWDRFHLEQVLLNLLMNAIRYGNKGPISVKLSKDKENMFLSVRDKGIGIKPEDQTRIFERFERVSLDDDIRGIGLGLFISKNIVQAHNGEIQVQSELGQGSEFTVVLPIHPIVHTKTINRP